MMGMAPQGFPGGVQLASHIPFPLPGDAMNWDRIEGNWKQLKGHVRETWGRLTDDQLDQIAGKRDTLMGNLQTSYGIAQDEAEKQVNDFLARCERDRWVQ
jgi:uncharacterized protein YjbJ (UPF0337 family)